MALGIPNIVISMNCVICLTNLHNAVMGDFIYLIKSEMIVDANLYIKNHEKKMYRDNSRLLETNEKDRARICRIWLNTFKKKSIK